MCARGAGVSGTLSGSIHGLEGSQSLRRASSIRRTFTAVKRKNVCLQVKFTVVSIIFIGNPNSFQAIKFYVSYGVRLRDLYSTQ